MWINDQVIKLRSCTKAKLSFAGLFITPSLNNILVELMFTWSHEEGQYVDQNISKSSLTSDSRFHFIIIPFDGCFGKKLILAY